MEDRVLSKRIFDLREAAASLAGGQVSQGGGVEMFQLSQDIENLISRQRGLMQEKDDHERHIKWVDTQWSTNQYKQCWHISVERVEGVDIF